MQIDETMTTGGSSRHGAYDIDVCICTYRRETLADTMRSIEAQVLPEGLRVRVIVADNDETPSAYERVRAISQGMALPCVYVHAPARNISIARNACLDTSTAPLLAFIDDDEVADPRWLTNLRRFMHASGATAVFGPVRAIYGEGAAWLAQADMHSTRPAVRRNGDIDTGYTCNVLIDRRTPMVSACRFDPKHGRTGGEDTYFFHLLKKQGATLAYCPDALVTEDVPAHRATLPWLMKRSFRAGQSHAQTLLGNARFNMSVTAVAAGKMAVCLAYAGAHALSAVRWRRTLVRGALHAGVVARSLGMKDLQLY